MTLRKGVPVTATAMGLACASPLDTQPRFVRYEIAESTTCNGCPAPRPLPGPFLTPGPDGVLTLHRNRDYIVRVHVRTAGRGDRCIYKIVGWSWDPRSNHYFNCMPETGVEMEIDDQISTQDVFVRNTREPRITMSLTEYDTEKRKMLSRQLLPGMAVQFVP